MSKLAVKYLDPETGEYKYATVADVGDLDKLKTTVKSDLVSAINSIEVTGDIPIDVQNQLDEINQKIIDVKNSGLTDIQLAEIDKSISDGVGALAGQLTALETKVIEDNAKLQAEISEDINTKLSNVESDYNAKVKTVSDSLDGAKTDISNVALDLSNTKNRLQNTETNYIEVSTEIDGIHGELSSKVESSEFDLMQSKVTENTTAISQTRDDISLLATKTSLDLVTDRVSKAESDIQLNADGLTSRVTYTELNKQLENVSKFGDNLVRGTRDWDGWKTDDILKAYISNDTYRHCKIQVIEDKQYAYYTTFEDMEIGKTYTVSIYFKVKTNSDYVSVNFLEGENSYALTDIEEDTTDINGWKRVSVSFVPAEKTFVGSFKLSFLETDNIGYLVAPKIEIGGKASDWKPHFDDDNEVIVKNQTLIKQNSDSIATLVSTTEKQGEDISQAETKITQTSESVLAQASKIQEIEGEVSENKASIELANEKIELKVSQTDIDKSIADITLDTKNRIINSDFSFGFSNWNERNEKFVLKDIEGVKYASITRSGLTSVSIASMASDKFPVKNNENLMISSDIIVDSIDGLDDKGIMSIELFNIEDVRVFSKTFNISELYPNAISNVKFRGYSKFRVDREDVSKARVKIQLNKNGSINFSKISIQKGDLNEADWISAPEDEHLYRVETQTSIDQNAQEIVLKANKTDLDASNKKINDNTASIEIANDNISQVVTNYETMSNRVTQAESSITQNANSITQKVSSIDVENILTGKSYATQSQLTQDLDGFKTTVSNTYLSKSDASGTYADKNSVASQITQSATAVTSNVQSWTNNKLTAYSTTQQTANSITNAVADKADKSQITQLSNQITSVVTDVSAIQVGGQNLLLGTATAKTSTITKTNSFTTLDPYNFSVSKFSSFNFEVDDYITLSFDWETTSTTGDIRPEINLTPYGFGTIISAKGTNGVTSITKTITASEQRGHIEIVFKVSSTVKVSEAPKLRLRFDNHQLSSTFTIKNAKLEKGNKATDWCIAPQEVASQSQITQLSDSINLNVSKGDVVSQINVEAGQILFNSNKLVLNANTTEIAGDAFIRGDMIVDGSINAEKLEVQNLSALSSSLGDITGGSYTSWSVDVDPGGTPILNGVYLYNGRVRSVSITNPTSINPKEVGGIVNSSISGMEMFGGYTDYYYGEYNIANGTADDMIKGLNGMSFWSQRNDTGAYIGRIVGFQLPDKDPYLLISAPRLLVNGSIDVGGSLSFNNTVWNGKTMGGQTAMVNLNGCRVAKFYGTFQNRSGFVVEVDLVKGVSAPIFTGRPYAGGATFASWFEGVNNREWAMVVGVGADKKNFYFESRYRDGTGAWSNFSGDSTYIYRIEVIK